jgi:hypothetical protein
MTPKVVANQHVGTIQIPKTNVSQAAHHVSTPKSPPTGPIQSPFEKVSVVIFSIL